MLSKQEIVFEDKAKEVELLVNDKIKIQLIKILENGSTKEKVDLDLTVIDYINKYRVELREILMPYRNIHINLFPETVLYICQNDDWLNKLAKLNKIFNQKIVIELLENSLLSEILLLKKTPLEKIYDKTKIKFELDDMISLLLRYELKNKNYFVEKIPVYLNGGKDVYDGIKIDMDFLKQLMIKDFQIVGFWYLVFSKYKFLKDKKIIFEGIENEEIFNYMKQKINVYRKIIDENNIKIGLQGYYFHKPEKII